MMPAVFAAPRIRILVAVAVVALAAGASAWCALRGGDDGVTEQPGVRRRPPSAGWDAVDVPAADEIYSLRATRRGAGGVAPDTRFVLESDADDLDPEQLPALLRVEPEIGFTVEGGGGRSLTVRPSAPLREETSYKFTLVDAADRRTLRTWAFQTEGPLSVVQTLPAAAATNVPLDTGIELTFSRDGVTDIGAQFSITPPVEGTLEYHKRVAVFVPDRLAPETVYTVTVAPGVRVARGDLEMADGFTFAFETGSAFRRDAPPYTEPPLNFSRLVYESATAEPPVLEMANYGAPAEASLPVVVYRFADAGAFIDAIVAANSVPSWSYFARREFRIDASGLPQVATFTTDAVPPPGPGSNERYVFFPDALEAGFYLVQTSLAGETLQALLQVTDLAAYASTSDARTVVWVNDLATKGPAADATVRDRDGKSFDTGDDGIAFFDTPESLRLPEQPPASPADIDLAQVASRILRIEHDGREAVVPLTQGAAIGIPGYGYDGGRYLYGDSYYYGGASPDFWAYVYPDRRIYHRTDEINVWGVARRRENFSPGEELTVRLTGGDYLDYHYRPSVVAQTTATVSDTGTFRANLPFSGVAPGSYQIEVTSGDEQAGSSYVQIEDFVKPAYEIRITPSRAAAIAGEPVTFDVATEFFDGSPVPFMDLLYGRPEQDGEQPVTTDAAGAVAMPYVAAAYDAFSGPSQRQASARPAGAEQSDIFGMGSLIVLPAALTIDAEGETEAGVATVSGEVHLADLSAFEQDESGYGYAGYEDFEGAAAPGRAVSARVTETTYNQVEVGEIYDFIAKVVRKQYRYDAVERDLGLFPAVTGTGGAYSLTFPVQREKSYRAEVSVTDDAGRIAGARVYVSGDDFKYDPYMYGGAELYVRETEPQRGAYEYPEPRTYAQDAPVDLTVQRSGGAAETGAGYRYLFLHARDGLRSYGIEGGPRHQFTFGAGDVPNVYVFSVQFNGHAYDVSNTPYNAAFETDERAIEVVVTADRERYEPGDDVTLTVETRRAGGDAVSAEVLLSAVDEAVFAAQGYSYYESEFIESLYASLSPGIVSSYDPSFTTGQGLSARAAYAASPDTGGGRGGGGDGGARIDFKDLALFETVRTDASGRATLTFTLPDNITSWRVTSRAVTGDLLAGAAMAQVPVGLPFFVEVTAGEEYLAADRPVIGLRAFGRSLARGDAVEYRVSIPSLGVDGATVTGEAFLSTDFVLPPLAEGTHEMTVEGTSGELSDALVRELRVVSSRLRRGEARYAELAAAVTLEGASDGRTRVVFADHNRGRYYDDLVQLGWTYGDRVDQMIARELAQELVRTYFEPDAPPAPAAFDAAVYQREDGGIALFPYAGSDLVLSARMAAVAPDRFGRNGLAQYFRGVLDNPGETRERSIIALFGLAAAGEAVLPEVQLYAADAGALSLGERLYLGLAALAAGDEGTAREQYRQVMLAAGESREPFVRIRDGVGQDDILQVTVLAADLAAGLGDSAAPALFEYTQRNRTTDILVELEQISYLARAVPRSPSGPVRFSYALDGQRHEQELEAGASFAVEVSAEQLAQLDPRPLQGSVGVTTYFEAAFDPSTVEVDGDVGVTRVIDLDGGGIAIGEEVLIRLDYQLAPQSLDGCYQVTDLLPSGLRPVTRPRQRYDSPDVSYPYRIDGQRVSFCVYRDPLYHAPTYLARVVTRGTYIVEPAIIQSQQSPASFNFAPATTVEIR